MVEYEKGHRSPVPIRRRNLQAEASARMLCEWSSKRWSPISSIPISRHLPRSQLKPQQKSLFSWCNPSYLLLFAFLLYKPSMLVRYIPTRTRTISSQPMRHARETPLIVPLHRHRQQLTGGMLAQSDSDCLVLTQSVACATSWFLNARSI